MLSLSAELGTSLQYVKTKLKRFPLLNQSIIESLGHDLILFFLFFHRQFQSCHQWSINDFEPCYYFHSISNSELEFQLRWFSLMSQTLVKVSFPIDHLILEATSQVLVKILLEN